MSAIDSRTGIIELEALLTLAIRQGVKFLAIDFLLK